MASNNYIYKMSNAGGMSTITRYTDMLAGNTTWNPWSPAGAYESIATVTVPSGGAAAASFTGIPATYTHLQIRYIVRSTQASTETGINARLNSDTGSNYAWHYLFGDGASVAASAGATQTSLNFVNVAGANATASAFAVGVLDILDYANTSKFKTLRLLQGWDGNGSGRINLSSGLWMSTSANNAIEFYPSSGNWAQFSQFALYGVKGN
jgi:hypothetical protein